MNANERQKKLEEFWSLPEMDYEPMLVDCEPKPLSVSPIEGDDIFIATDENGQGWVRSADGTCRVKQEYYIR